MQRVIAASGEAVVDQLPVTESVARAKEVRRAKRIVHMSSVHPAYDTRIFLKECRSLAEAGYDVTYVSSYPADPQRDGVKFVSVPQTSGYMGRMFKTSRAVYKAAKNLNGDLYHFHDPEMVPWGLLLRMRGKKVVMDVHENTTRDIMIKEWIPRRVRKLVSITFGLLEKIGAASFNGVVAAFPALLDEFPRRKTVLAGNLPILGELNAPGSMKFKDRPRRAAYVGQMTEIRGIYELMAGLAALPKDYEFDVHIAGQFMPDSLLEDIKSKPGYERLKVLGTLNRTQVADLLNSSRFGVVFFKSVPSHLRSLPTKLFEYASAGLPTLGPNMEHWAEFLKKDRMGFLVDISNPGAVAERMMYMNDHPDECQEIGAEARIAVESRYSWDADSKNLIGLYDRILGLTV